MLDLGRALKVSRVSKAVQVGRGKIVVQGKGMSSHTVFARLSLLNICEIHDCLLHVLGASDHTWSGATELDVVLAFRESERGRVRKGRRESRGRRQLCEFLCIGE